MKVLISAFNCNPVDGSEFEVGWQWATQAAKHHEVWAITAAFNEAVVRAELTQRPNPNLHFVFHPLPLHQWSMRLSRRSHASQYAIYLAWQLSAVRLARRLHARIGFDVTHHVTWASCRFPSFLAWVDAPFIWGPVGGGERAPNRMHAQLGRRSVMGELARDASTAALRFDPLVRFTARRASRILVTTPHTLDVLPPTQAGVSVYPAIGLDVASLPRTLPHGACRSEEELRVLFTGRLTAWKGTGLALHAVARLAPAGRPVRLTMAGDGPERDRLHALAVQLGIDGRVDFLGNRPRAEVLELCASHDVFLFPSLHDSGGIAVLEAMALGLPVVCLDVGGPALSVSDAGIRVACESVEQVTSDLAAALESLAADPGLRHHLGRQARCRVEDAYDWEKKGLFIKELYESAAAR